MAGANVGEGESYQPTAEGSEPGVYKNPIPTIARVRMGGPWPSDPVVNDWYAYSASFYVFSDGQGELSVYGWADLDSWTGSQHGLLNGFGIGDAFDGDANLDGQVSIADLGILAANWQAGVSGSGPAGSGVSFEEALGMFDMFAGVVVPEPGVVGVLLGAGLMGLRRPRWPGQSREYREVQVVTPFSR